MSRESCWRESSDNSGRHTGQLIGSDTFFELMFGVAKAGMALVPVQRCLAEREIENILADAEIGHLFLSADQFGSAGRFCDLPTVRHCLAIEPGGTLTSIEDWMAAASDLPPPVEVHPTNVAWQIYTSGTTGLPKGVMLSHRNILDGRREGMEFEMEWFQWRDDDVNLVALPVGHVGGVGWDIVGFFSGATTVIHREFVPADAGASCRKPRRHGSCPALLELPRRSTGA